MAIELIAKIAPKNDGFTGMVDADQVLGGGAAGTLPDATVAISNITQHVGSIDHDSLLNFDSADHLGVDTVKDTHIDWGNAANQVNDDDIPTLASDTYKVRDALTATMRNGIYTGIAVSEVSGLDVEWTEGIAFVDGSLFAVNSGTTVGNSSLTDDATNYLYIVKDNATLQISTTHPTGEYALVSIINTYNTAIHNQFDFPQMAGELRSKTWLHLKDVHPIMVVAGLDIAEDDDATNVNDFKINTGSYYSHVLDETTISSIVYSSGVGHTTSNTVTYYHSSSAWTSGTSRGVDFAQWDPGTDLTNVNVSKWYCGFIFLEEDDVPIYVYPQTEHSSKSAAAGETLVYPPVHEGYVVPIARFVFRGSASDFTNGTRAVLIDIRPFHGYAEVGAIAIQNLFQTITGDSGSTTADEPDDTLTIAGTANQITTAVVGDTITLSTPQDIHTGASPTFVNPTMTIAYLKNYTGGSNTGYIRYYEVENDKTFDFHGSDDGYAHIWVKDISVDSPLQIYSLSHNSFADYDANKHIDHTGVSISTTTPLAGGGTIASTRTLTVGGLSSIGTSNYVVGVNNAGNAWEYKQMLGAANEIDITHAAGSITVGIVASPTLDGTNFTGIPSAAVANVLTSTAVIADHTLVRGDGGARIVQDSGIAIDDSDNVSGMGTLACGAITSTGGISGTTGTFTDDVLINNISIGLGILNLGKDDDDYGWLKLYGNDAVIGGTIFLYNSASYDTVVDYWEIRPKYDSEDFVIQTSGGTGGTRYPLTIDGTTLGVTLAGTLGCGAITTTSDLTIPRYIKHTGDADTHIAFTPNVITFTYGGTAVTAANCKTAYDHSQVSGGIHEDWTNSTAAFLTTNTLDCGAITSTGDMSLTPAVTTGTGANAGVYINFDELTTGTGMYLNTDDSYTSGKVLHINALYAQENAEIFRMDVDTDNAGLASFYAIRIYDNYSVPKDAFYVAFIGSSWVTYADGALQSEYIDSLGAIESGTHIKAGTYLKSTTYAQIGTYLNVKTDLTVEEKFEAKGITVFKPDFQVITAAGDTIEHDSSSKTINPDANYTLTSTPTIANGALGQLLYLTCIPEEPNTVTIQDEGTLGGSSLRLGAATRTIGAKDTLVLRFDGANWCEVSYSNKDTGTWGVTGTFQDKDDNTVTVTEGIITDLGV